MISETDKDIARGIIADTKVIPVAIRSLGKCSAGYTLRRGAIVEILSKSKGGTHGFVYDSNSSIVEVHPIKYMDNSWSHPSYKRNFSCCNVKVIGQLPV